MIHIYFHLFNVNKFLKIKFCQIDDAFTLPEFKTPFSCLGLHSSSKHQLPAFTFKWKKKKEYNFLWQFILLEKKNHISNDNKLTTASYVAFFFLHCDQGFPGFQFDTHFFTLFSFLRLSIEIQHCDSSAAFDSVTVSFDFRYAILFIH